MNATVLSVEQSGPLTAVHIATEGSDCFTYVTAADAIARRAIEVREVSEMGSVNNLLVLNNSPEFVFMADGDILAGAKQNRVVNTSILLFPNSKTTIPVSCVEHGRWHHVSAVFDRTDYVAPSTLRAEKALHVSASLKAGLGARANQSEVWDFVARKQMGAGVRSGSDNLSDLYEQRRNDFDRMVKAFKGNGEANGLAIFAGTHLLSLDIFHRRSVMQEYFPRLLRGLAAEIADTKLDAKPTADAEARYRTMELCDLIDAAHAEEHPGVGAGTESRFTVGNHTGFALRYKEALIHLTALELKATSTKRGKRGTQEGREL